MTYASTTRLIFNLRTHSNNADVQSALDDLQPITHSSDAIESDPGQALANIRTDIFGRRGNRRNNPDVVVFLNSGTFMFFHDYNNMLLET